MPRKINPELTAVNVARLRRQAKKRREKELLGLRPTFINSVATRHQRQMLIEFTKSKEVPK